MERGQGLRRLFQMSQVQIRAAVKAQKEEARRKLLVYRGVAYLKQEPAWAPERVSV